MILNYIRYFYQSIQICKQPIIWLHRQINYTKPVPHQLIPSHTIVLIFNKILSKTTNNDPDDEANKITLQNQSHAMYIQIKQQNNTTTKNMQFTEFTQLQSFHEMRIPETDYARCEDSIGLHQIPKQFHNILNDMQQINHSRSVSSSVIADVELEAGLELGFLAEGTDRELDVCEDQFMFTPSKIMINYSRRSTIFTATRSTDEKCSIIGSERSSGIQVYYFGMPTRKYMEYQKNTTVDMLINKALKAYTEDLSLDQNYITSKDSKNYQMRFLKQQGSYEADYTVDAISRDRMLTDSIFEILVLVKINRDHRSMGFIKEMPEKVLNQFDQVRLNIFNQANIHVSSLIVSKNQDLKKAIDFLQAQLNQKIVLLQSLQSDLSLPPDMDIKNLGTYKLYVKKKRFLDQPQTQRIPLKIISTVPKDLTLANPILSPIGITEASRYEEFEVIKINRRGVQQPRIIGFDQTKYYNYDVSVRKKNKQASFLSVFIGNNLLTGTKKPERLISEIQAVNSLSNLSFQIILPEKKIQFKTDTPAKKQKILRKLKFLIDFNRQNKKN